MSHMDGCLIPLAEVHGFGLRNVWRLNLIVALVSDDSILAYHQNQFCFMVLGVVDIFSPFPFLGIPMEVLIENETTF